MSVLKIYTYKKSTRRLQTSHSSFTAQVCHGPFKVLQNKINSHVPLEKKWRHSWSNFSLDYPKSWYCVQFPHIQVLRKPLIIYHAIVSYWTCHTFLSLKVAVPTEIPAPNYLQSPIKNGFTTKAVMVVAHPCEWIYLNNIKLSINEWDYLFISCSIQMTLNHPIP